MTKKIQLYLSLILTLLAIQNSNADVLPHSGVTSGNTLECIGRDGTGATLNVIYDKDLSTLNVNGVQTNLTPSSTENNVLVTEKYIAGTGIYVYSTLNLYSYTLTQYNAATDSLIVSVPLNCH